MARPGVTYTEIAEAAAHLIGQGKQPTIEQIRLLLGTGSSTTIANHLKDWKERQQSTRLLASKEQIPHELIEIVKGLWDRVIDLSKDQVAANQADVNQQIAESQQELQKYKTNNQRWQQLFTQWTREKEKLMMEKQGLEQVIVAQKQETAALQVRLEMHQEQINEKQARIMELQQLHLQAQKNVEHFRASTRVQYLQDQEKRKQELKQIDAARKLIEKKLVQANQENKRLQRELMKHLKKGKKL